MKTHDKYNIISAIQTNLNEMQQQAQQYLDKHHGNLPPICSARHYLFKTIEPNKIIQSEATPSKEVNDDKNIKKIKSHSKNESPQSVIKQKTAICNLQFTKKLKFADDINNYQVSPPSSTSMKLRMSGVWKFGRYMNNASQRSSLNNSSSQIATQRQKLKTIVMSSDTIDVSDKDLKLNNGFSPRISIKLDLPKKQSQILQKYISRFKQYQSEELKSESEQKSSTKLTQIVNKSNVLLQNTIQHESLSKTDNHCRPRRCLRRNLQHSIDNPQRYKLKQKLEKQLLELPYKNRKQKGESLFSKIQQQCTPWENGELKNQQKTNFDFL